MWLKYLLSQFFDINFSDLDISFPSSIFKPGLGNRIPIGLNLKFNKANQEIPGYTRKGDDERGTWLYSTKLEEVLKEYMQK